ncbi:FHA domain-containing protein [Thiorhodococcus mannitoliphagus]|uniref:FHA domain-containing protein n=1 Tax=Thiorhodococcus mannitoliphagus TaxID=329406 RepID=A0A6P1DXA8_9GAMM|nr:FHA domain-containing protein [Thiorhodococcus mannitoliphagus]NEX21733.1 FHA domain-containing protein [Thiorhodococcus mannitoliphagus]
MRIRLVPLDSPDLSVIEIRDALVGVGRDRGDFRQLPATRTARLSERHARLYDKNRTLYVVDLGSRHGTFVNGQAVADKPVALKGGDEINFGGELPFRIELPENSAETEGSVSAPTDITLVLEPADPQAGPDPIRIKNFPFFVSKSAPTFAKYAQRAAAELDFISRRHAQVSRQGDQLLLQDLGSTNGTFLDDQRVGADPVVLENGQKVAFGGSYFVYRIAIQGQPVARPPAQASTAKRAASAELDKTTFLAAGTSFLDILCVDNRSSGPQPGEDAAATGEGAVPASKTAGSAAAGRKRKAGLLQQIDRTTWRRLQIGALALLALLGTAGYFIARESPTERIESLLAAGRGDEALQVARTHFESLQGDSAFERLALRALAATTLEPWLDAHDSEDFARMQQTLEAGRAAAPQQPWSQDYLDTLALIGDVERLVRQHGGVEAPLRVLDREVAGVREIVDAWNRPRPDKRQVTQRLLGVIPPSDAGLMRRYRDAYQQAGSDIRALESQLSVYAPAVRQLEATLARHLRDGSLDRLSAELDGYAERYSQLGGFEALQQDLSAYRALVAAASEQRVIAAIQLATTTRFHAEAFAQAAERLVRDQLPEQTFLDAYAAALDAWRAGETERALAQLEALSQDPSGEIARREIARMQGILDEVNALQGLARSPTYDERLLQLYQTLDPNRDQHIQKRLERQYADSRTAVERRALQAAEAAVGAWDDYRAEGRITSTLRLRSGVSQAYKQRAAMLSRAASNARQARRLFEQSGQEPPQRQAATLTEIEREVALQHQALDELSGVVAESTLQGKQALLPERLR